MKTRILFLFAAVIFAFGNNSMAQNGTMSISLTKSNGKIYTINETGKHLLSFEITGIQNASHAENIEKYVSGYRGVEEFNLVQISGTNKWKGEGTFYEYADLTYFKNLFKLIKVTEVIQDNVKTSIENL
jgi:hypothetical protein